MAVFLRNNCSFTGCGQTFSKLSNLIHHIEDCHIASDPDVLEKQELQQPPSTNIGYILKFFEVSPRSGDLPQDIMRPVSPDLVQSCITPTGSEFDCEDEEISVYSEEEEDSENSLSSTITQEDYSYEFILGMVRAKESIDRDKPLKCPVSGCKKQYKNINGMKYHAKTAHKKEISKSHGSFTCHECQKNYKTQHGLRNHFKSHHPHLTDIHIQFITNNSQSLHIPPSSSSSLSDVRGKLTIPTTGSRKKMIKSDSCDSLFIPNCDDITNQNVNLNSSAVGMETSDQVRMAPAILPAAYAFVRNSAES